MCHSWLTGRASCPSALRRRGVEQNQPAPKRVEALRGIRVSSIAVGDNQQSSLLSVLRQTPVRCLTCLGQLLRSPQLAPLRGARAISFSRPQTSQSCDTVMRPTSRVYVQARQIPTSVRVSSHQRRRLSRRRRAACSSSCRPSAAHLLPICCSFSLFVPRLLKEMQIPCFLRSLSGWLARSLWTAAGPGWICSGCSRLIANAICMMPADA